MLADELSGAGDHAAEVVRPRLVGRRIDQHVADLLLSHFQREWGAAQEGVDLPLRETLYRRRSIILDDPVNVLLRVEAYIGCEHRDENLLVALQLVYRDCFAFQFTSGSDLITSEQFDAAGVDPGQDDDRFTRVDLNEI